jgi:prolyl 4-hydroxylase
MNFIYTKPQALSKEVCEKFIENFETSPLINKGHIFTNGKVTEAPEIKSSSDITFNPTYLYHPIWGDLLKHLVNIVEEGINEYTLKFSEGLYNISEFKLDPLFNIQRYYSGEGYHKFHCERGANSKDLRRVLVWMLYLNDVTDGGQTEFYYQQHKEVPEQGKLVIWPSDWTHIHRGITSSTQTKYILTGWFSHA